MSTGWVQGLTLVEHQIEGLDIRFYTINHHKLLFIVKVGFQDLSSKTKVIAQSIQEKSDQWCQMHWTCPTETAQHTCYHRLHKGYHSVLSLKLSQCCVGICMLTGMICLDHYQCYCFHLNCNSPLDDLAHKLKIRTIISSKLASGLSNAADGSTLKVSIFWSVKIQYICPTGQAVLTLVIHNSSPPISNCIPHHVNAFGYPMKNYMKIF